MSYRCIVTNFTGNYKNDPKVHVFSFPEDELTDVWIRTIERENFSPTKFSRVSNFFVLEISKFT